MKLKIVEFLKRNQKLVLILTGAYGGYVAGVLLGIVFWLPYLEGPQIFFENIFGSFARDFRLGGAFMHFSLVFTFMLVGSIVCYMATLPIKGPSKSNLEPIVMLVDDIRTNAELRQCLNKYCLFGLKSPWWAVICAILLGLPVLFIVFALGMYVIWEKLPSSLANSFIFSPAIPMFLITPVFLIIGLNIGNLTGWAIGSVIQKIKK